jgi:hypothetical protein
MTEELRDSAKAWVEANYPALEDEDLDADHYRYGDNPRVDQRHDLRLALTQLIEQILPEPMPTPLYVFEASDWFNIPGRGDVAVIKNPAERLEDYDLADPDHLKGQLVSIDGKPYTVRGVETFLIARSESRPYRLPFSLLVSDR